MHQPALETLDRHRVLIAVLFWASSFSGPLVFALAVAAVRRHRRRSTLRWIVDQKG